MAARGLLSHFTRHATLANIVMVAMIVAGVLALPRMRAQFFPDSVLESVRVTVAWPGAGAEDVDRGIVQTLEPGLMAIDGVEETTSRATEGNALITLDFESGWDMSRAVADVETAVASASPLPEDAEEPSIRRSAWRDGVVDAVITGPLPPDQLGRLADEFVTRLYDRGITRTAIQGLAAPDTLIEIPAANLRRYGLTLSQIADVVAAAAATAPAGDVGAGNSRVRTGQERRDPADLAALVLRADQGGEALRLGDIAIITRQGADRARASFVGDHPAVSVQVQRSLDGDAIAIAEATNEVVAQMRPTLPEGVRIDLIRDRADIIDSRLALLLDNALTGLALVVVLLFLFLNARTAIWVAAGIPVALMAALAAMYVGGMTFNMISIFALILTLGIVVDDAIVVGEHADFRHRMMGEPPVIAAENAARRMASPVVSSTLTTVIAFVGLMLIGGRFGTMIADIPKTVIFVLAASLIECFLILPHHMSHALAGRAARAWYDAPSRVVNRGLDRFRQRVFRPLIGGMIRLRYPVIAALFALFAASLSLLITGKVSWRFFDAPEQSSVTGNFSMLPGATREDTIEVMQMLQATVTRVAADFEARHGANPVTYLSADVGGNQGRPLSGADTKDPDQLGAISMEILDPDLRPYSSYAFIAALQEAVPPHPRLEELSFRGGHSGPGGDSLSVQLSGAEASQLKAAAEALKTRLAEWPVVSAVEDNLPYDKDELLLELTPQGRALGFSTAGLARELRARLNGIEAASYPDGPRSATITLALPDTDLAADFLDRMQLRAPGGAWVALADIVSVETRAGFSAIRRENGTRILNVTGEVAGDDPARAAAFDAALTGTILPEIAELYGVDWAQTGLAQQERDFMSDAMIGFGLALLGIYVVLAWIFASWTRPVVVMAVIPFGLIGAVWGHYAWGISMSMFSVVGLIGMSGIIINDSIVLISTVDEYAVKRGLVPAIIDAVADRLRPVLLTTLTTVLGLAPMLFEGSSQALFLKPTVITLVYGLGFGLLLVLAVVPAVVAVQQDLSRFRVALHHGLRSHGRVTGMRWLLAGAALGMGAVFAATVGLAMARGLALGPALGQFALAAGAVALAAGLIGAGRVRPMRRGR